MKECVMCIPSASLFEYETTSKLTKQDFDFQIPPLKGNFSKCDKDVEKVKTIFKDQV